MLLSVGSQARQNNDDQVELNMDESAPIRYTLNRYQRIVPHLHIWGWFYVPFYLLLQSFFFVRSVYAIFIGEWAGLLVFGGMFLFFVYFCRGLVVGLVDAILHPVCNMDITISENGLGVMLGTERWYLFLDGFTQLSQFTKGVWTLQHWNGAVVNIPETALSGDQLEHIQSKMAFGKTEAGFAATVERGKVIQHLLKEKELDH
jgi:hypothetical protein